MRRMLLALPLALLAVSAFCTELDDTIGLGKLAPNFSIDKLLTDRDYVALGLDKESEAFELNDIKGDVLILELFNRFCLSCWEQAGQMQVLWANLGNEGLRDRVKLLALGQGNSVRGVNNFIKKRQLTYPVTADPNFTVMDAFGDPGGTPLSLFLVREAGGWRLADYHIGKMQSAKLLASVKRLLAGDTAPLTAERGSAASHSETTPELSDFNKAMLVSSMLKKIAGKTVNTKELTLEDGTKVYQAVDPDTGPMNLFVRLAKRRPVCDLCHTNTFAFAFDAKGNVLDFQPLYVTKIGNTTWSEEDTAGFMSRLVGKKMASLSFDVEVDAVTGASMSSALIFDEIRKTEKMLKELVQ